MRIIRKYLEPLIGIVGVVASLAIFIKTPSFPTPDKILIFLAFVFMIFRQLSAMLKHLLPFVAIILAYESFRSMADKLNSHIDYLTAAHFDKLVFGNLPTVTFQSWLWTGHVRWYDFIFYGAYMLHFIIPIALAVLVWKTRERYYWRVVTTYVVTAFAAFFTYLLIPAAPPWLASQSNYIQPIERISSDVWAAMGLHDFPSYYNQLSPNLVAAIPSLHAAWATLLVLFVFKLYGGRWAAVAGIYPFLIFLGTIYQGEHYAFDVILGIVYGCLAYILTPHLINKLKRLPKSPLLILFKLHSH